LLQQFAQIFFFSQPVDFIVTIEDSLKPISPYIYGTNQLLTEDENWTALRQGGNRMTGYNWEKYQMQAVIISIIAMIISHGYQIYKIRMNPEL
jgi:hypothetical protein